MTTRHTAISCLLILGIIFPLAACKADNKLKETSMQQEIVMDVILYSYLNRPISDVFFNKKDIGVAGPFGGGGVMTGVVIGLGSQALTWTLGGPRGTPRNGEQITAKNKLTLDVSQVPVDSNYMAVHIYPDDTFELSFSKQIPEISVRGSKIVEEFQKHHGQ